MRIGKFVEPAPVLIAGACRAFLLCQAGEWLQYKTFHEIFVCYVCFVRSSYKRLSSTLAQLLKEGEIDRE